MSSAPRTDAPRERARARGRALTVARAIAVLLVALVVAVGVAMLGRQSMIRLDLTPGAAQSLSPRTLAMLRTGAAPVSVALVAPRGALDARSRRSMDDLFARLSATSAGSGSPVDARWIDPMTDRGATDLEAVWRRLERDCGAVIASHDAAIRAALLETDALLEGFDARPASPALVAPTRDLRAARDRAAAASSVRAGPLTLPALDVTRAALRPALDNLAKALNESGRDEPAARSGGEGISPAHASPLRDRALRIAEALDAAARAPLDLIAVGESLAAAPTLVIASGARAIPIRLDTLIRAGNSGGPGHSAGDETSRGGVRIAGEEAIASAIGALTNQRAPVVVLVHAAQTTLLDDTRSGRGAPATPEARQFFGALLDRLRLRGVAVVEWAIGATRERPSLHAADPSGARPIVWVAIPVAATTPEANARAALLAGALKGLLDEGANALITLEPSAAPRTGDTDPIAALLEPFGVRAETALPLFRTVNTARGATTSPDLRGAPAPVADDAHPIARAVAGPPFAFPWPSALALDAGAVASGRAVPLVAFASDRATWGERRWLTYRATPLERRGALADQPAPDPTADLLAPPSGDRWVVAAAAERRGPEGESRSAAGGSQRVVIVGSSGWFFDPIAEERTIIDGRPVVANPGNAELFDASIEWLAGLDDMIAPSHRAAETPRIAAMPPARLETIRWGVALGPPTLVALAGFVWRRRRG